ncbi:sulfotransferase 1E1-like isoform X2 [Artemia franciscana]|uniref:sulfotransferase 1E1-like isoform X2 n=1 Tax=Artemia franciscana TaxID=6661 RepID=UPI0032DA2D72
MVGSLNGDATVRKTRLVKRLVAAVLFSGTLGIAVYVKHKKIENLRSLLENCKRLPDDPNYGDKAGDRFLYNGYVLHGEMIKNGTIRDVKNFEFRPQDVVVASFPKSGTTWLEEIVFLIQTHLDFKLAASTILESRFPYLEYPYPGLKSIAKQQGGRMIKTHLPLSLLPDDLLQKGTKVIYIMRNPKDVAVSYYHFFRLLSFVNYKGEFRDFLKSFMKNEVVYTPYFPHVLEYWNNRDNPNLLVVHFEEMKKDPETVVQKISNFLGKDLTYDEVRMIVEHTRFENMAINPSVNYSHWEDLGLVNKNEGKFFRKGAVGDWQNYFSEDLNRDFDSWISQNLENTKLAFIFADTTEDKHKK